MRTSTALSSLYDLQTSQRPGKKVLSLIEGACLGLDISEGAGLWRVRPGWDRVLPQEEKEA